MNKKIIDYLQSQTLRVVRVNQQEFELDNGDIYPIPFALGYQPTVKEFQRLLDNSKTFISEFIIKNG